MSESAPRALGRACLVGLRDALVGILFLFGVSVGGVCFGVLFSLRLDIGGLGLVSEVWLPGLDTLALESVRVGGLLLVRVCVGGVMLAKGMFVHLPGVGFFGLTEGPRFQRLGGVGEGPR